MENERKIDTHKFHNLPHVEIGLHVRQSQCECFGSRSWTLRLRLFGCLRNISPSPPQTMSSSITDTALSSYYQQGCSAQPLICFLESTSSISSGLRKLCAESVGKRLRWFGASRVLCFGRCTHLSLSLPSRLLKSRHSRLFSTRIQVFAQRIWSF